MSRRIGLLTIVLAAAAVAALNTSALADSVPTGERQHGQVLVEPAYDDATGQLVYLATPIKAPLPTKSNDHATAPLWLVVYRSDATALGALNCEDSPTENCPDHGPEIAGLAQSVDPTVYGSGVRGHDHLVAVPAGGGDFNIAWDVHVILFSDHDYATSHHLTTLQQVQDAIDAGKAFDFGEITTFTCAVTSAHTYDIGTPVY